ncbi:hypothetical protein LAZ67_1005806 [Cordylochernes scorpioides]|uniref:Reverse transcriptase domain-containing protein n=1 Tax=Cordylochernes scorpioides TaxID=51811 RepID=A0ABY6K1G8_9ARAC|nr:hypothetical protein LAZ67_1005806 [Cordylochernes scorpioides]
MSRFNKDPREVHMNGLKRILRYLKGTVNYELIYSRGDSSIVTYTDASWDRTADARSYSGFVIEMGNNLLNWKSNKQRNVALSTAESELEALSEGIKELIWTRNIIGEMKIDLKDRITVYCDSQNAISMIKSKNMKASTKYLNRKCHFIRQIVEDEEIEVLHVPSEEMKADHLTKSVDAVKIKNCLSDGTPATNDKIAANLLGNSYQISSKIKVEKRPETLFMTVKMSPALIIFSMKKINMKELAYALENTDLNKTPGPDGIHGRMISNLGKIGKERLLNIFNNSWKTGKLPQDCKNATIIPIKKLDKSADDPKNYRPISLTNICCKLMEKIIFRRPTYHPDTRNLLPEEQYGFRKGHGTIVQLLFFTQKLITKLYKHFKIDGKAITWINDSLKNIYIRVKYNGTLSKTFKFYQGLPQGSVLSPTLFTLFIAGIEDKFSHKTNIGLFADDIILWNSNTNWKKDERDLNKTILHLEKFANKHKLEFNPQKSET